MTKTGLPLFLYPSWMKVLGLLFIVGGLIIFFHRISQYDIIDFAGLSFPVAVGLTFIFFSRGKEFDERIVFLKFKALAIAVPLVAFATMLINYYFNFEGYSIEADSWFSISAFEYLSLTLIVALGLNQYLLYKE
ncbi:hypothetical protein [Marinoscillum sp.]|uniref:hypothetical protein n=1 Tax=Marinoscillum sp. TaxID=2024838 RepID=UPI003BA945C2